MNTFTPFNQVSHETHNSLLENAFRCSIRSLHRDSESFLISRSSCVQMSLIFSRTFCCPFIQFVCKNKTKRRRCPRIWDEEKYILCLTLFPSSNFLIFLKIIDVLECHFLSLPVLVTKGNYCKN